MKLSNVNYELYLVTDQSLLHEKDFITSLEEAILGGVTIIQLREKALASLDFYKLALQVKELTTKYNIPLIINDRLDIALAVNADGVHVGQQDLPAAIVRQLIGDDKLIGVSTANLKEAQLAERQGADYIGVGALFSTSTKDNTRDVSLEQAKKIKASLSIPVVGIGGINETNVQSVKETNIDGIAVVSAILGKEDIQNAAKNLKQQFVG